MKVFLETQRVKFLPKTVFKLFDKKTFIGADIVLDIDLSLRKTKELM